jgi:glyoxylase-like metal-dependent hydrolase (beta-lactamase superfamily II)
MKRRHFLASGTFTVGLHAMPGWIRHFHLSNYNMKHLRGNVGIFTERGGTIGWLIQEDHIVVIDAQFREQANHFLEEVRKKEDAPIRYLINTHHHGDHTSGNIAFKGIARNVLAHENSRKNQMDVAVKNGNEAEQLYPDMIYTDRWQEKCGNETIDIQYWGPAHTNGDSIIHFQQANIVHCGDLIFNRRYPYIDKGAGARIDNWIEILQQLQTYFDNDTLFIFGHAAEGFPVTGNKDDIAAFADYLTALLEYVSASLKAGKSREDIMVTKSIPGADQWKGDGIERSLTAALEELSQ